MTVLTDTDYPFALCLTHDVDRPYKTAAHALFYAVADRDPAHLRDLPAIRGPPSSDDPYWQFETVAGVERDLGVRSAFYLLQEPPLRQRPASALLDPDTYVQLLTRYDLDDPDIAATVRRLDADGWEVGVHGSLGSATDRERLAVEVERIEALLGHDVAGGRQHYLDLAAPETWAHYRDLGLSYDASLGSRTEAGFRHGHGLWRPFDDGFVVFPLTLMDQHLPDPGEHPDEAWAVCTDLLDTAARNDAVMTALFHPRLFAESEFPGYRRVYRRLVESALDRGAWVGSPGAFYEEFLTRETTVEPATPD